MAEFTIEQRQQFTLLRKRGVEPELARELTFQLYPERKSGYPDTTPSSGSGRLPSRINLNNLDALPPEAMVMGTRSGSPRFGAGDQWGFADNSAVFATVNTVATACTEAPILVKRESAVEGGVSRLQISKEPRQVYKLLRRPNLNMPDDPDSKVFMSIPEMVWLREYCLHVDGNAYWQIVRLGDPMFGLPVMLIPLMPYMVAPVTLVNNQTRLSRNYIDYYAYAPNAEYATKPFKIHPRNMLHFRYGRDPRDLRMGLGVVKRLAREIARDDLATFFTNRLLRNGAVPGLVVTPEDGAIDEEEAREAKAMLQAAFSGDALGAIAILSRGAKVEQFGFDPEQLNLASFHKHAEERIAAVLNVPAMVAQLGAGLEQASQFSNFHEAREMFAENTVIPRLVAANAVLSELMQDFTDDPALFLVHDQDQIRALQGDVSDKFGRYQIAVRGGWMTANEARALGAGLPPIDEKSQQVPLTQGEDNRINTLVQMGGITLNEARQTVGLPPIEGGDEDIVTFRSKNANALSPPENQPDPNAKNPVQGQPGNAPNKNDTPQGNDAGGPTTPGGAKRPGADTGPGKKSRAEALERLFANNDPDRVLTIWRELREEDLSFVDTMFPVATADE